jgi:3-phenylpropionate/trans-cinnamate dioxygenase ferredoxin reductase component
MVTTSSSGKLVVVGAGQAGAAAAVMLRQSGYGGSITLLGDELHLPYRRPPLSKAYLRGSANFESLRLWPDSHYKRLQIALHLGTLVEGIDRGAKHVITSEGNIDYDTLILATGSRARKLSIADVSLRGVLELRSLDDANALHALMRPNIRLVLIGGGYVGLEAAATARSLGAEVVLLEREGRLLARVASEPLAHFFEEFHRDRGVHIVCAAEVQELRGTADGQVNGVVLRDGRCFAADVVVVGVGAMACDSLAIGAGLACQNGIVVDERAQTSDPSIFAIGDATSRPLTACGGRMFRLESVPNALEQARQAANAILGLAPPIPEVPWFWSDQYDSKLQIAGVPFDRDALVIRGSTRAGKFSIFHLSARRLVCVEAVNSSSDFAWGKKLIGAGREVSASLLADTEVEIKSLAV